MDIQRLKTLRELSMRGTMAAVADAVGLSPSAVSQQISLLEDEVGVALVERRGRGVALTPAGEMLVRHAIRLLDILEEAKTDLAEMKQTVTGEIVLCSFPSLAASLLPKALRELQMSYPDLVVSAVEMEPSVGLASLRSWQVDLAIVDDLTLKEDKRADGFDTFAIYEDRIVAVMHKAHPLAKQPNLELTDFRHEYWAIDARPNTFSDTLYEMCAARGFEPRVIGRFDAFDLVLPLAANRAAIALLPQIRILQHESEVVARQFDPPMKRTVYLAIRRGEVRRPALKAVLEMLQQHAEALPHDALDEVGGIKR